MFNKLKRLKQQSLYCGCCFLITHSNINIDVTIKYYVNYGSLFLVVTEVQRKET